MKKILSIFLVFALFACFAACDSGEDGVSVNKAGDGPVISLYADKKAVAPGDELIVTVNIADAENCASFDLFVKCDSDVEYISSAKGKNLGDFYIEGNESIADGKTGVVIGGFVMTTYTLDNDDVLSITYKVPDSAKIGKTLKFNAECDSFDVSDDPSGDDSYSVMEKVALNGISVKVAQESVEADRSDFIADTQAAEEVTTEETTVEETASAEGEELSTDETTDAVADETADAEESSEAEPSEESEETGAAE